VDKLLMNFHVGELQQPHTQCWRGFQPDAFGYNEGPTKQLPYIFCWKARHKFDVPFFCLPDVYETALASLTECVNVL